MGVEPLRGNTQVSIIKELTENTSFVLSTGLDETLQIYPELRELVKAWPKLPENTKTAIKALVQTHIFVLIRGLESFGCRRGLRWEIMWARLNLSSKWGGLEAVRAILEESLRTRCG